MITLALLLAGTWIPGSVTNAYGIRAFYLYVPEAYVAGTEVPLVVGLHGCTQTAADFAGLTRIAGLGDRHGVLLLLPEQNAFVNPTRCWNWPIPQNQRRGEGEPSLIKEMIDWVTTHYSVEKKRIYIGGVSSGGFMTSTMLSCYSDVFAAGMVASGGMYAATTDPYYGSYVGPYGSMRDPNVTGREAWQCSGSVVPRVVPVLVFQGSDDAIVIPLNALQTVAQFAQMNDLGDDGLDNDTIVNVPARTSSDRSVGGLAYHWSDFTWRGKIIMQLYIVEGMGHAWSGGDPNFAYSEPAGPDETEIMWAFFAQHSLNVQRARAVRKFH